MSPKLKFGVRSDVSERKFRHAVRCFWYIPADFSFDGELQNKDECKEKVEHHLSKPRLEHLVRWSETLKDMMLSRLNGFIIELTWRP